MMPTLAPACFPAHEEGAAAHAARTGRLPSLLLRRRGASVLLSLACLTPLAACAAQPAAPGAADSTSSSQAAPDSARQAAPVQQAQQQQQQQPAPATPVARQPQASATQPQTASPGAPAAVPNRPAQASAGRATAPAAGTQAAVAPAAAADSPAAVAPQERATTVGEVPTTARNPAGEAPGAVMPGAPAAIPGTPANPITIPQAGSGPSTGSLLQTVFALVLVLGLLAALAWLAKRYGPKIAGGSGNLRMVGSLNIGGRERIMVVEVGDQWIVVGASPGRINALATMPKQEGASHSGVQSTATLAGHAPSAASFSDWLKQTIDKRNAK